MNEQLEQLAADPWGRLVLQHLASGGIQSCFLFLLVAARLAGVFIVAPGGLRIPVPLSLRIVLVILLSLIIAPTLLDTPERDIGVTQVKHTTTEVLVLPESPTDLAFLVASEIGLGALLGVGVIAVLSGLSLGGEWLDRSSGLGLGRVLNPDWSDGDPACSRLMSLLAIAVFMLMEPLGGQWLLLRSLVESFVSIPIGTASWSTSVDLLNGLVQHSLVLGIRIAIPLVVTMLMLDITLAFANRNTPVAISSAATIIRAGVGIAVLAFTLTAIPEVIAATMISLFS
ncbi:MAG: flagellar biosynthetic protein FliR [Schlesneria sp.]